MPAAEAVRHPLFARVFDRLSRAAEDRGQAEHRREMLAGLGGRVVEVGAGNGLRPRWCSAPSRPRVQALAELRRVIRPGGELRVYEHVRAPTPGFARFQRVVDLV